MTHQSSKSDEERPQIGVNEPNQNDIPDEFVSSTHITDLDDDCLEHIFKELGLKSLLNVADSTKLFKQAADRAFVSKFGKKEVNIRGLFGEEMTVDEDRFLIGGRFCLKLLRSFGHSITKLKHFYHYGFEGGNSSLYLSMVDRYINDYCANSLIEVTFENVSFSLATNIKEPYSKAETVHIQGGSFESHSVDLSKCFPSVQRLTLIDVDTPPKIDRHFTHLEHFKIDNHNANESLLTFIELNPQLRGLEVGSLRSDKLNAAVVLSACGNLPNLESFGFVYSGFVYSGFSGVQTIHFKSVKKFRMDLESPDGYISTLPFIIGQLEEFTLELDWRNPNEYILNFISKHPTILKLKLILVYTMSKTDKTKLAKLLPSVKEVDMDYGKFSVDEATEFLSECKQLQNFRFELAQPDDFKMLSEVLKDNWIVKIEKGFYDHAILEKLETPQTEACRIPSQISYAQNAPPTMESEFHQAESARNVTSVSTKKRIDEQGAAKPATKRTSETKLFADGAPSKRPTNFTFHKE